MNQILIGIKPNLLSNLKIHDEVIDVVQLITKSLGDRILNNPSKHVISSDFVSALYEGNEYQKSCVEHYGDNGWYFFVIETELPFKQINEIKKELRIKLKKYSIKSDHPADNCIHISDSPKAAKREIELLKNYLG